MNGRNGTLRAALEWRTFVVNRESMVSYAVFKFIHVLGVVLLIGNVTTTSVWKVFADRSRSPTTIAFAQRLVGLTDWWLTGIGIVLVMVGGYGMSAAGPLNHLIELPWLFWSQVMFVASGAIWLLVLVPIQVAQSRQASRFTAETAIPETYWKLGRRWIFWGVAATVLLVVALFRMVTKW